LIAWSATTKTGGIFFVLFSQGKLFGKVLENQINIAINSSDDGKHIDTLLSIVFST
jgi:hypothetical protein